MKRLFLIMTAMVLMCTAGCGSNEQKDDDKASGNQDISVEQTEESIEIETIEAVMDILTEDGFKKTDKGYVWTCHEEDVDSEYILTAKGNTLYFEGHMDFGKENSFMAEDFRNGDGSVSSIPDNYLVSLADYGGDYDSSVKYVIYVGNSKVAEGKMSYKEADKIISDIDD